MDMINLMECGHVANATDDNGNPACVICGCFAVRRVIDVSKEPTAGLEGRKARCADCGKEHESKWTLPFFQYRPEGLLDSCYDGCYGWD